MPITKIPAHLTCNHQALGHQACTDHSSPYSVLIDASTDAPDLAAFQQQFGQYLRAQRQGDLHQVMSLKPSQSRASCLPTSQPTESISTRVATLYQSLVFNNICSFLHQCFPVCQTLISAEHWLSICEQFFLNHNCHSPYFTEINQSFVDFLAVPNHLQMLQLPPYFAELAHYEWVELLVETNVDMAWEAGDAITTQLRMNSTLQNLHYQWPVHAISADDRPKIPEDSFFLVYRTQDDRVEFMKTNALTYALIDFVKTQAPIAATAAAMTDLLRRFAVLLGQSSDNADDNANDNANANDKADDTTNNNADVLVSFGLPLLVQLSQKQVLFPVLKI